MAGELFADTTDRDKDQLREVRALDRWGWCRNGNHEACRVQMPDGCGGYDVCGCPCHRGEESTC